MIDLKTPPNSIDAEFSVLGGLLIDNDSWDKISSILTAGDFYQPNHRILFNTIEKMLNGHQACDVLTVSEYLKKEGQLKEDLAFLGSLVNNTPSASNIVQYGKIIREKSILRQLIHLSNETSSIAIEPKGQGSDDILQLTEQKLFNIAEQNNKSGSGFTDLNSILKLNIDEIDLNFNSDNVYTGLSTGFCALDKMTTGLKNTDLIIIAARPSQGKTELALNVAVNSAIENNAKIGIFSLEMSKEQLGYRLLSSIGKINYTKLTQGDLDEEDWLKLTLATQILQETTISIDDTPDLTPSELRSRARKLKRTQGLDLLVVDYLQLMSVPGIHAGQKHLEVEAISKSLKALAKELNIPVIALSQLNRSLEERMNKRPIMSDLRHSGAIEQDADLIMFIYRDEIYNEDSVDKGMAEIIIGKHRNGPLGMIKMTFVGEYTKFEDYSYFSEGLE
ncbi:MAG: replicative DNA helicase [gamma proteobacterium symbiont of Lucinoma myriamae]|nr:replicative DNA helicase [gamma proteobacterium symbiont of Lucinoma myriamae]MCU7817606.1 replicative DNA helicase [gamma proteobacterium symbiont of Lucinoma myriamae]